ncbi:MAG: S8 family serine peptidase [Ruminococcus sp.]|nr:S8 family serine peptidase [Ruminococcus sp.]
MKIKTDKFKLIVSVILSITVLMQCSAVFALEKNSLNKKSEEFAGEYAEGEAVVLLDDSAAKDCLSESKSDEVFGEDKVVKDTSDLKAKSGKKLRFATIESKDESTEELISELRQNNAVEFAVPNYKRRMASITNDPYSDYQWALENKGQNGGETGADINPDALWSTAKDAASDVIVAVLDTGIDYTHEDLKNRLWVNPYGSKLKGVYGYDFTNEISDHSPRDNQGHGTHVAGIIAAQGDNLKGICGVNKSKVKIMALKMLDSEGEGYISNELEAYEYIQKAAGLGANIKAVNCSFGGISDISTIRMYNKIFDSFGSLGIVTCVASGNENLHFEDLRNKASSDYKGDKAYYAPAESTSDYVITVTGSDEYDEIPPYSNTGKSVDIAAPGSCILSTVSNYCFNPSIYSDAQKSELCKYCQDFENSDPVGFGKPDTYNVGASSITAKVESGRNSFSSSGGMVFSANSTGKNKLVFSFPYTIDNTSDDYLISFMIRTTGKGMISFDDRSGSFAPAKDYARIAENGWSWDFDNSYEWSHMELTNKSKWLDSKNRQLVFYVETDGTVAIDDLAISYQGCDKTKFGKYDFITGTSMSAPFVSGAVALIANARRDLDPYKIVRAVKSVGRDVKAGGDKIETGKTLDLKGILNYEAPPEGKTGSCKWELNKETGVLTVSGSGKMADYDYSFDSASGDPVYYTPWSGAVSYIRSVVVKNGVTSLGEGSFASCKNLTEISLPSSVVSLGRCSLFDTGLTSIELPNNITAIGSFAFGYNIAYCHDEGDWDDWNNLGKSVSRFVKVKGDSRYSTGSAFEAVSVKPFDVYAYTGSKTASCLKKLGYKYTSLGGLTLSKSSASLYVKQKTIIKPILKNLSTGVSYSSSNSAVAKVSASGKVTAVKKGNAKIAVKSGDLSQTFTVTVKNPKLNVSSKTLKKGKKFRITVKGLVGKAVFKSSNKKVAAVTASGLIKAKAKGKAVVTVKANGAALKCKVTVK